MKEERMRVLDMLAGGQITAQEAADLLDALSQSERRAEGEERPGEGGPRWFHVRITDVRTGRTKTDINIPVHFGWGLRFADRFMGRNARKAVNHAWHAFKRGQRGTLVDVTDDRTGERVQITLE